MFVALRHPRFAIASLFAVLLLWPAVAEAQFWSPWFSRGSRPPPPRGGVFATLPPWGSPSPAPGPKAQQKKAPEAAKGPTEERPVPYDKDLARLAELLGALHYLRPLCGSQDRERWRTEMQELIDTEQPSPERKDRLVASFNRGYQSYELTYRNCTASASLAIGRSLDEGAKLARAITTKYGN